MENISIIHTHDINNARRLLDAGYCPIELSLGGQSIVDELEMDHHGCLSHLEGVAVRAYRDHFGARKNDPRFVVTGAADSDATFCIAALCGILPHPSRAAEFETAPPWMKAAMTKDVSSVADLVNRWDIAPIGIRREESEEGIVHLLWNQLSSHCDDALAFYSGVDRWNAILGPNSPKELLRAAAAQEADRVAKARTAEVIVKGECATGLTCPEWGFDVWYADHAPCIAAFNPKMENITLGCESVEKAEQVFGPGGLKNVFPRLGEGWGGRESVGGSPRGVKMKIDDLEWIVEEIEKLVK